jgi:hypothetical protein
VDSAGEAGAAANVEVMRSRTVTAAAACLALLTPQVAAQAAAPKPRSTVWQVLGTAGATNHYPQQWFQFRGFAPHDAVEYEAVGGVQDGVQGTEDRFQAKAVDMTGRPVAVTLYWYANDKDKDPKVQVICGATKAPLPIIRRGAVHAMVTAGEGCPGGVSAPTRTTLTFTWTTAPKPKRQTRR